MWWDTCIFVSSWKCEGSQFLKDSVFSKGSSKANMLVSLIYADGECLVGSGEKGHSCDSQCIYNYLERVILSTGKSDPKH